MIACSFSGALMDLKPRERTTLNLLRVLAEHPRVSTWDMSEHEWVRGLVQSAKRLGLIQEMDEPFPWLRYRLTEAGERKLKGGDRGE